MHCRTSVLISALMAALIGSRALAQSAPPPCPGNPDALATSRVITVDAAVTPRVGRKHFPATLPLADKEVVLTFDDGPWPGTTAAVLDALRRECVRATFFLLGQNAAAHPELARRELAEGHTVAHHSFQHPLLDHMSPTAAEAEIDHGFAAVDAALYGPSPKAKPPKPPPARRAGVRTRRSSASRASPRPRPCWNAWRRAGSWYSEPTCGRATGTR